MALVLAFKLRKQSAPLLITALLFNVAFALWHAASKTWIAAVGGGPSLLLGALVGYGIFSGVCIYAERLAKAGVLT